MIIFPFQVDEVVLLGGADKTASEVTKLLAQMPPAVKALTGVDLSGVVGQIPGASKPQASNV